MRVGVLETGEPPAGLDEKYGGYGAMFAAMLAPVAPEFAFTDHRIFDGAPVPEPDDADAFIVTGSPAGVYEDHAWIPPLEAFIRAAADAKKPNVGICFGHQAMAQAFGGEVTKSSKGWGVGLHVYHVVDAPDWMSPAPQRIACAVSHQDQVIRPPDGARRIAGSNFCLYGALQYAQGPAVSFQMHPEFEHDFAAELLALRADKIGRETADLAGATLRAASDRATMAVWIANFLRGA